MTNEARRTTNGRGGVRVLTALALCALLPLAAAAQERDDAPPVDPPEPEPTQTDEDGPMFDNPLAPDPMQDARQRMIELFHAVERKLKAVDEQLAQAGTGVLPLEAPADAGLDDLLREATAASRQLTDDIDRMLELAQQMNSMQQQQQQSQGGQQGQQGQQAQGQPGESPLDQRSGGGQQGREETPEGPREDGGRDQDGQGQGDEQQQGGEQQGGEQDDPNASPDGQTPDDGGENPDSGRNREGDDPDGRRGEGVRPGDDAERWGELPVRVREVFRNQGRDDLPVQYRDWIDAYYRRLNSGDR